MMTRYVAVVLGTVLTVCGPVFAAGRGVPDPVRAAMADVRPVGGWAVHVGTTDGSLEMALAEDERWVVTGLAHDRAAGEAARAAAAEAGQAGRATIHDVIDTSRLPMPDRTVALLVVNAAELGQRTPTDAEARRVLRPGGAAVFLGGGGDRTLRAGRPQQVDDWTHFNYDATASDASRDQWAGPIKSLRWMGGDPFHDDIIGMRSAAGVYVSIEANDPGRHSTSPPSGTLVARDAYCGVVLWRRPGIYARSRYSFIVDDRRVYLHAADAQTYEKPEDFRKPRLPNVRPMRAFDLYTGEDAVVYDQGLKARTTPPSERGTSVNEQAELVHALLADGKLIQKFGDQIAVLDPATGEKLWSASAGEGERFGFIAADGGRLVATHGPAYHRARMGYLRNTPIFTTRGFTCFDLESGRVLWRAAPQVLEKFPHNIRIACQEGVVAMVGYDRYHNTQLKPVMTVIDLDSGDQLWTTDNLDGVSSGGHYPRPQIHHGKVWATGAGGGRGFDLRTGDNPIDRAAQNFRCSMNRATPNWLISSQKFTRIEDGRSYYTEATRGRCDFGLFPANGMVYGSIGEQCGCAAFVRPTAAFGTERLPAEPWDGPRLLAGPAGPGRSGGYALDPAAWPMFLHDTRHSSWTETPVGDKPAESWRVDLAPVEKPASAAAREWSAHQQIPAPVTPATVYDGTLCVALSHLHTVVARDPVTGQQRWRARLDGRIDSPPTLAGDTAFVGTRTGWVYALDRATGQVRWRFLAVPHQQLAVAHGQAESLWPVFGSVLLHDGLVWAAAGRQAELDHGLYWYGLDPATGAVRPGWRTRRATRA